MILQLRRCFQCILQRPISLSSMWWKKLSAEPWRWTPLFSVLASLVILWSSQGMCLKTELPCSQLPFPLKTTICSQFKMYGVSHICIYIIGGIDHCTDIHWWVLAAPAWKAGSGMSVCTCVYHRMLTNTCTLLLLTLLPSLAGYQHFSLTNHLVISKSIINCFPFECLYVYVYAC